MSGSMPSVFLLRILVIVYVGSWPARAVLDGPKSIWPAGTTANASSTHHIGDDGTTFYGSNAIDGNTDTKWNDDTRFVLPDILTIELLSPIILDGIIILSGMDGWLLDYTVETSNGTGWVPQGTVTNCEGPLRYVPFTHPIKMTQVKIVVTDEQDGGFTRIHEVYPVFAKGASNTSESNPTPSDVKPHDTTTSSLLSSAPNASKCSDSNIGAIVGGVLGGIILILFFALAALLAHMFSGKHKQRTSSSPSTSSSISSSYPIDSEKIVCEESITPAELSTLRYGIPGREPFSKAELEGM